MDRRPTNSPEEPSASAPDAEHPRAPRATAPPDLRRSLNLITVAGCLAMIYTGAISSPATTEFFRSLGAREIEFGLLGGIPLIMLFFQFAGALLTNRTTRRKPAFMALAIASRTLYLAIAFIPLMMPPDRRGQVLPFLIVLIALSHAMANLMMPLWMSWMGDLIPRRRLSSYWGQRHVWMQLVWIVAYLGIWLFTHFAHLPITVTFPILACVGVTAAVIDILLFLKVDEPVNILMPNTNTLGVLTEPLRHDTFRTFVLFSCAWSAAVQFAAAFMQLYVLDSLGLSVSRTILIWCMCGTGGVLSARAWGRMIDRHGARPVLVLCVSLKSTIVITFLLITRETATVALIVAFFFDSMLNAGNIVASNGYMLRTAPRENRSAFIAAITGLAGICGGIAALAGAWYLRSLSGVEWPLFGRVWNHYQILFATDLLLRLACIPLVRRIREPRSSHTATVLTEMHGEWPLRMLLFPVGLYRTVTRAAREQARRTK